MKRKACLPALIVQTAGGPVPGQQAAAAAAAGGGRLPLTGASMTAIAMAVAAIAAGGGITLVRRRMAG